MKRFLFLAFAINFAIITVSANTEYNPNRPEWNDFCPLGMINAQKVEPKWYNSYYAKLDIKDKNYWADRRIDFEQSLTKCDSLDKNNQNACYEKLKQRQASLNSTYISPQQQYQADLNRAQGIQNMLNQQEQVNIQKEQLNLQKQQVLMQNMTKWSDVAPKQYNVNLNHNIRYNGF